MARYLLDTNVLSELSRPRPSAAVTEWLRSTPPQDVATSIIVIGEILEGVLLLEHKDPQNALRLQRWLDEIEATHLVLAVDEPAIREWARMRVRLSRRHGFEDMLIAATALAHRLTVVTRNVRDFMEFGVPVLDPWREG